MRQRYDRESSFNNHRKSGSTFEDFNSHAKMLVMPVLQVFVHLFASHLLTVFYAKRFVWNDLYPPTSGIECCRTMRQHFQKVDAETRLKVLLIFLVLHFGCKLQVRHVHLVTFLLAIPQLYRLRMLRDIRVILGPLTPLLSIQNVIREQTAATILSLMLSLTAFVVLRPDNTQVLDLLLTRVKPNLDICKVLESPNSRRKLHGSLAFCNTLVAALGFLLTFQDLYDDGSSVTGLETSVSSV